MKQILRAVLGLIVTASLVACASAPQRLNTPSGRPEITIMGVTKKQVIDTVVEHSLADGFRVLSVNDYSLVLGKDVTDFSARLAYGSDYNRTPQARVTYNLVDTSGGVRVFIRSEMITNPQSQYEKATDFTTSWGEPAQAQLVRLKTMMEVR